MKSDSALFENIIVGLDFSSYSRVVLRQAQALARRFNATLHVLHSAETPALFGPLMPVMIPAFYVPPNQEQIEMKLKSYYKLGPDVVLNTTVENFPEHVVAYAEALPRPMIVLGAYGHSAISRFLLGNYAERVALEARCPVWVHRGRKISHFQNVLLPVDLSDTSRKTVGFFKNLPAKPSVKLNYLFVQSREVQVLELDAYKGLRKRIKDEVQKRVRQFRKENPQLRLKVTSGDPAREIIARCRTYDVIAMSPHNKTGVLSRFGRVTTKVIRLAAVPVLVIKPG